MTARRIFHGLKSGLTFGLAKGLGLAGCIYVTLRDNTFSHMMSGIDNCFLRFPFGYTCNNATEWHPDFHIYSQSSLDTWHNTSNYLITLVGSVVLLDTAIKAYRYSTLPAAENKNDSATSNSILATGIKASIYGAAVSYVSFAAYRETLPVYNFLLPPILDWHFVPPVDSFFFRSYNQEACDVFNTYSWLIITGFVMNGVKGHYIRSNWNTFSDWTRHIITNTTRGFCFGAAYGSLLAPLSYFPTRDFIYTQRAADTGHSWSIKFPRFGFECTPSPEFDDNLHGTAGADAIKFTLLYTGPAIMLLSGTLNAGYQAFQAHYTFRTHQLLPNIIGEADPLIAPLVQPQNIENNNPLPKIAEKIAIISCATMTSYGMSYTAFSFIREALTYQDRNHFEIIDPSFREASNTLTHYFDIATPIAMGISIFACCSYKKSRTEAIAEAKNNLSIV